MPLPSRFRVAAASRFRVAAALICAAVVASGCSGGADDAGTGHATLVDSAAICSVEGVSSALALADGEGTREGMANDPVGTAADNNPLLGDLVAALTSADLLDTLDAAESLTVFAPTDCAFAMADRATLDAALADPGGLLTQILGLHVIPGQRLSAAELGNAELETFTGQTVTVSNANGTVVLNGRATVVVSDIQTANATVHLVDTVLTPGSGGTTETAGPEVPGAPANSAEACDTGTLIATIGAGPEQGTIEGMADDPAAAAAGSNPVLTTLVTALAQANLVDTLNSSEALTVFAPTDCAFATLDPGLLERALADPGGLLSQILGFHVLPGQRLSFEELTGGELPTINGRLLPVTAADGVVTLNGQARIVLPNIQTANATVHLIDTVMLPPVE